MRFSFRLSRGVFVSMPWFIAIPVGMLVFAVELAAFLLYMLVMLGVVIGRKVRRGP